MSQDVLPDRRARLIHGLRVYSPRDHARLTWDAMGQAGSPELARLALLAILLGWAPLALLTSVQSSLLDAPGWTSFVSDFAVHARSLLAAPLLILAHGVCASRLRAIIDHFVDAGLVQEHQRPHFDAIVSASRRELGSTRAVAVLLALAYAMSLGLLLSVPSQEITKWQLSGAQPDRADSIVGGYSIAGCWHAVVSLPLLLLLLLGWTWRVWLWARFLWLVSRMDLALVASHPDRCVGLKFAGYSMRAFSLVACAMGIVGAGRLANNVVHLGISPFAYWHVTAVYILAVVALFFLPLLVFTPRLLAERRRGVLEYGALADRVGSGFERRWLKGDLAEIEPGLESPHFSAVSDLYQIVASVHAMHPMPADLGSIAILVGAVLVPFVPIVLLSLPLDTIVLTFARFFF